MKKGDMRREELLLAAERLFYTKGYEKTTVQDILDAVGFSKGGFYHHFDSKLSVLEAICERRAEECCERARQAADTQEAATDKLNAVLHDSAMLLSGSGGFVSLLINVAYREDGALMRERMKARQIEMLAPLLEEIVGRGTQTNEFFVADAQATAQLLLQMVLSLTDEIAFMLVKEVGEAALMDAIIAKLNAYRTAIERVLVAPFASVVLFDAREMQMLAQEVVRRRLRERADAMLSN